MHSFDDGATMATPRPLPLPRRGPLGRLSRRQNLTPLVLSGITILLAALIARDVFFPAGQNVASRITTAVIGLGNVSTSVTGTGQLVPGQQINLGFKSAGTLTAVNVHSGDHVNQGQLLATIDPTNLELALQQAQASLANAEATLSQTESGTSLQQALDSVNQAEQNYTNAVNQQSNDQANLNSDTNTLNADRSNYWYTQYQPTLTQYQNAYNTAQAQYQADGCNAYTMPSPSCTNDNQNLQKAQNNLNCVQMGGATCNSDQQQIAQAYKNVNAAQAQVNADQSKVNADGLQVQSAQNQVTNAQDSYNNQAVNRPAQIAQQEAAVASAQAGVNTAQSNLDAATLTAPFSGVISNITAQVGDTVSATSSSAGSEAPGTTALIPNSSGSSGSGAAGGSAFMTLLSDSSYMAVISFAESDAAKIQTGQPSTLTFDAVSGLSVPGKVVAVAAAPTITSNVTNYYVTISLDSISKQLRDGLTTNAVVTTASASNVLRIPNAAIHRLGQLTYVLLLQGSKQVQQVVQLGVAGDQFTQVMAGVQAGDTVVLPSLRSSATGSGGGRLGGGGGFGGGGGVIVGGGPGR